MENIELLKMLSEMIQVNLDDKKHDHVPESAADLADGAAGNATHN